MNRRTPLHLLTAGLGLIATLGANSHAAPLPPEQTYSVHGLQGFTRQVRDLNDLGFTTGHSDVHLLSDTSRHAVLWDETGTLIDLDPTRVTESTAYGMNNLGDVVGKLYGAGIGPVLFSQGSISILLDQNGNENLTAFASDLNDQGLIVGCANDVPVQWSNSAIAEPIPGTPANATGCAITANNLGHVVGNLTVNGSQRAVLWRDGVMIDLGVLPGHVSSAAVGINELDQVVGVSSASGASGGNTSRPFLWDNGNLTDLGTLSGETGHASDINDLGEIVGNAPGPFLWRDGVMYDLQPVAPLLQNAIAINETGQIAGTAYVLTPAPNQLDLAIDMTGPAGPLPSDAVFDYEIQITNRSAIDGEQVVVTDPLPSALELVSAQPSQGRCGITLPISCELGMLAAQASAMITLTVKPNLSYSSSSDVAYVLNTARVSAANTDVNSSNDGDSLTTIIERPPQPVVPTADVAVGLSDSPDPVRRNRNLTLTATVVNNGPSSAINTVVTESISTRYTLRSIKTSQGSCNAGQPIRCDLGDLPSGAKATIEVVISPRQAGSFFSSVIVSSDTLDPAVYNNNVAIQTQVVR